MAPQVLHSFPAYEIVEPPVHAFRAHALLKAGDRLALVDAPMRHYQIGSVASYALDAARCPIEAVKLAKERGHPLYYVFALGSAIVAHDAPREQYLGVRVGQKVWFEGHVFEIEAQPNRNLGLAKVGA